MPSFRLASHNFFLQKFFRVDLLIFREHCFFYDYELEESPLSGQCMNKQVSEEILCSGDIMYILTTFCPRQGNAV